LAVTFDNHSLDVRQMRDGGPIISGLMQPEQPFECKLSPDGSLLGVMNADGTVKIWDLSMREAHELATLNPSRVQQLIFHPTGRVAIVQRMQGEPVMWDLTTWTQRPGRSLFEGSVFSMLSDDGRWLFTCDADHNGRIWDTATGKPLVSSLNLGHEVKMADIGPKGQILAVVSPENEMSIWDLSTSMRRGIPI